MAQGWPEQLTCLRRCRPGYAYSLDAEQWRVAGCVRVRDDGRRRAGRHLLSILLQMKVYSRYVGTIAPRVFYMFLHGRRESSCCEIDMFFLLTRMVSPFDDVDIVKSTWADVSAVCAIHRHLPGLSSRNRINAGQLRGETESMQGSRTAQAPPPIISTAPVPTRGRHERINVGQLRGETESMQGSRTAQAPPPI